MVFGNLKVITGLTIAGGITVGSFWFYRRRTRRNEAEGSTNLRNDEEMECPICFENFNSTGMIEGRTPEQDSIRTLPCTHAFHDSCIRRWEGVKNTCPVCRRTRHLQVRPSHDNPFPDSRESPFPILLLLAYNLINSLIYVSHTMGMFR